MIQEEQIEEKEVQDTSPKETLYIRNINEKIKPKGNSFIYSDIKYALYNLF